MKKRERALADVAGKKFDVCVIGGGATGAGCALDSQLRGLRTALVDAGDFGGATSSASTKIAHGGVRYLEEAVKNLDLAQYRVVDRALRERIRMFRNAPHLCRTLEFLIPCFSRTALAYYGVGLKVYDWVSGGARILPSHLLSSEETLGRMPALKREGVVGAVAYADGQFDDSRYNIALVETFAKNGGEPLNYARVTGFRKAVDGRLSAAEVEDRFGAKRFEIEATVFVNATGPFADGVRVLANPSALPRIRLSKGVHILLPLEVMPSADALLIPKTDDGRVIFAVPWSGRLLVGTTEQEVSANDELYLSKDEVAFLLLHLNRYLEHPASAKDVVSGFAGARPLLSKGKSRETKNLSRDHEVEIDPSNGLVSIMGGKWTTYRAMAQDTIDAVQGQLGTPRTRSITANYPLAGSEGLARFVPSNYMPEWWKPFVREYGISQASARRLAGKFGALAPKVLQLTREDRELANLLVDGLPVLRAEVVYCARNEMAVTIEDVLFRRTGVQLYSWRAAIQAASAVAAILRKELGWSAGAEREAVENYKRKIERLMQLAGLTAPAQS